MQERKPSKTPEHVPSPFLPGERVVYQITRRFEARKVGRELANRYRRGDFMPKEGQLELSRYTILKNAADNLQLPYLDIVKGFNKRMDSLKPKAFGASMIPQSPQTIRYTAK